MDGNPTGVTHSSALNPYHVSNKGLYAHSSEMDSTSRSLWNVAESTLMNPQEHHGGWVPVNMPYSGMHQAVAPVNHPFIPTDPMYMDSSGYMRTETHLAEDEGDFVDMGSNLLNRTVDEKESVESEQVDEKDEFARTLPPSLRKQYEIFNTYGTITEQLRQEFVRRSKLFPKVRGVWFNSALRRMGWVGQAYKKCKRIERIFSVRQHGFAGARALAIEFRNSQKPTLKALEQYDETASQADTAYDNGSNDFAMAETTDPEKEIVDELIETQTTCAEHPGSYGISLNESGNTTKSEATLCSEGDMDQLGNTVGHTSFEDDISSEFYYYKTNLTPEEIVHRDHMCKKALKFMLHELSHLIDLDIPLPGLNKDMCQKGIQYHLGAIEKAKSAREMVPYIAIFGGHICLGIPPLDIPYNEIYSIISLLSYSLPLGTEFSASSTMPFVNKKYVADIRDLIVS
ncbi:AP2 domain family protein ACDC superfamily [Babesia bovis T2Bo]|uniref:AP2-coincident C-terminal domain-containing protein n=1 Tax=Babesia bovis TaxID=5865 RepID=A7ASL6_BABBO|nr:AP2 domain family protein ACDC superfamily [Babesia bovis T2Bo]EDO07535.1 AP2 domain family protein ACDC superfamily [Babesia bovis T2Bo]|eukprot:XP_001611103.1 hypothetical protein [Babesia bovis T2Bo]